MVVLFVREVLRLTVSPAEVVLRGCIDTYRQGPTPMVSGPVDFRGSSGRGESGVEPVQVPGDDSDLVHRGRLRPLMSTVHWPSSPWDLRRQDQC